MTDDVTLHRDLLTLDSHIDIPWPHGDDPFERSSCRRVDLPKLRDGGISAGCFAAYIPQGPIDADGHREAGIRCVAMLQRIRDMEGRRDGLSARVCDTAEAVEAAHRDGMLAIIPAIENSYCVGEDLSLVASFRALGVRYITLTHNGHNAVADSALPRRDLGDTETRHHGLSRLGNELITAMNHHGVLVDVSHLSRDAMLQALERSTVPVVATHSCVRRLCDHPRNLDDYQLDALGRSGGLIQITAMPGFLRTRKEKPPALVDVSDLIDHLDYVVERIGPDHVGLSSDFDGGGAISGWSDASQGLAVTRELVRRGYDRGQIAKFWGGNFLRLMRMAEQAAVH